MTDLPNDPEQAGEGAAAPSLFDKVAALILLRLDKMLAQTEGVRAGQEREYVHQMRVWSRRTRAALDIFHPCFDSQKFRAVEQEVKRVTRTLGAVRDLDVMIAGLEKREAQLPPEQQAGIASFLATLRRERRQRQRAVEKAMEELASSNLRERFLRLRKRPLLAKGKKRRAKSAAPFTLDPQAAMCENAERIVGERLDSLLSYTPYLYDPGQVYQLHEMRIAAKRLRYTLEIFEESVVGETPFEKQYSGAIEAVRTLQDHLGDIHDADVLVPRLAEHLARLMAKGFGTEKDGEPIAGVHRVDFDACEGLLTLCREVRRVRDKHYARLLQEWESIQEAGTFAQLPALLHEAVLASQDPAASAMRLPSLTVLSHLSQEAHHGEDHNPTAESLPPAPGTAKRAVAARARRPAPPAGDTGAGTDSGSGAP